MMNLERFTSDDTFLDVAESIKQRSNIMRRKSVRKFLPNLLTNELIYQVLDLAKQSPSSGNMQEWQVAVVTGQHLATLTQELTQAFFNNLPEVLDIEMYDDDKKVVGLPLDFSLRRQATGAALYRALGVARDDDEGRKKNWAANYSAFGAPAIIYIFMNKHLEASSYMDIGMFIQSVAIAAVDFGLATCIQLSLCQYANIVKKHLGYKDCLLMCGIAIGYEDKSAPVNAYRTVREDVATFTRFFE